MTLTLAGDSSSGIGIRVALTTISSVSASARGSGDEAASCARQIKGAAQRKAAATSHDDGRFCITSYLQFIERQTRLAAAGFVHSSHSSFSRRSFFGPSAHAATRMRWNGQIFWLLAFARFEKHASSFPPSPPKISGIGSWEVVSSYSSATAPESHGNSSHRSTDQTHKELPPEVAACACPLKIYLSEARMVAPARCVFL
jgi:hypothetical protein